ncbi:pyrrolysine--tRNA(Pyl) ligase large subunit [Eubacteriaceae bacterium ES2]|nr:pyrrolysine--tRNA(Pyl) ligase large subunit [Eubacteriaceae bacterium ES2]
MTIEFSAGQANRLRELGIRKEALQVAFASEKIRETQFKLLEKELVKENRNKLTALVEHTRQTKLQVLQQKLADTLIGQGFLQVSTPTIISRKALAKMSIDDSSPLTDQVFWLDQKQCLRPMLAPNLYEVAYKMLAYCQPPLKIFEIGSCFRKESEGQKHLKEFTMLNLVEWGTPENQRVERLKVLAQIVLDSAGIEAYQFEEEDSTVYGLGLDVVGADGTELASTSMGPHPLDANWKINASWVGLGFGLERLLMNREKAAGIHRFSRSTTFLDGALLNIK